MIDKCLHIYTDGGCDPNPGPGGWGFVVVENDEAVYKGYGYEKRTTNNRMEIMGAIRAIEYWINKGYKIPLVVYTDSQYLVNSVTKWMIGWRKAGWKKRGGEPVKNSELFEHIYQITRGKQVMWRWVKGHNGNKFNEMADQMATIGVQEAKSKPFDPDRRRDEAGEKFKAMIGDQQMFVKSAIGMSCPVNDISLKGAVDGGVVVNIQMIIPNDKVRFLMKQ